MTRLEAALKGETKKLENKVKRIKLAIETAKLNFKTQKEDAEMELEETMAAFKEGDVEVILKRLNNNLEEIESAEAGLSRIEKLEKLLFEEVQ